MLAFLEEAQLDRVGCFAYSPVDGAKANELDGHIPEEVKEERRARFMAVQEEISRRKLEHKVGKTLQVLVDEVTANGALARSWADAPEIDGLVSITDGRNLRQGDLAMVRVTGADAHDLVAEQI